MVVGWRCGGQAQVGAEAQVGSMVCEKIAVEEVWHSGPSNPRHHHVNLVDRFQFLALKKTIILRAAHVCEMVAKLLQNVGKS